MDIKSLQKFGIKTNDGVYATHKQIELLYCVPKRTLLDNIRNLQEDGLINGAKIRTVARDGKQRLQEVFTLEETIAIGLRLRSEMAIRLQQYATQLVTESIKKLKEDKRLLELELSYMWNKSDNEDLF
ncbi:hypothetical protein [Robiginitalea sp. IMCC43444]|uniref:hypothetical protein n=1 Tax=Robiginitalea sp. IMCC43444 TaxID=3459121 RepID=UPI004042EF53